MTTLLNNSHQVFPFAAIVGQEQMKLSLLLNAVHPSIGGVLIRGEKGTAKSTAVRGLANLLPHMILVDGCPFKCTPTDSILCPQCQERKKTGHLSRVEQPPELVNLPLGATEDMVCGTIDFEKTVIQGKACYLPGLLARAHRGILYIDEVNLLDDHLVDSIIDAAESEINRVEREGFSFSHPSSFMLVGTMNPEEGEIRPQLMDRFGLSVKICGETEPDLRVELLKRRDLFDFDRSAFEHRFQTKTEALKTTIRNSRELLKSVVFPRHLLGFISEICMVNNVAGHRADIIMQKAACAHAALAGRTEVSAEDISMIAPMVLLHRTRDSAPPQTPSKKERRGKHPEKGNEESADQLNENQDSSGNAESTDHPAKQAGPEEGEPSRGETGETDETVNSTGDMLPDNRENLYENDQPEKNKEDSLDVQEIGTPYSVKLLKSDYDGKLRTGSGRRSRTRSATKQGRYVKSTCQRKHNDLALDATIRAAAPFQFKRRQFCERKMAIHIEPSDIREKIRERRIGNFLLFVVDASGSMGAYKRMTETKAAIMSLLLDAYQKRDKVGMIIFRGRESEEILPPTGSIEKAGRLLAEMPVGGRTPISAGLVKLAEVLNRAIRKDPSLRPLVILLSDGKANAGIGRQTPHKEALNIAKKIRETYYQSRFIVIDTENPGIVRLNLALKLAHALGADYFHPDEIKAKDLIKISKENQ